MTVKTFPIRIPRKHYRGSNPSLRRKTADFNSDAARLEEYLNDKIASNAEPVQQFIFGFVARDVGMPEERVADILGAIDGGHTGLTVAKSAEAWQEFIRPRDAYATPTRHSEE